MMSATRFKDIEYYLCNHLFENLSNAVASLDMCDAVLNYISEDFTLYSR